MKKRIFTVTDYIWQAGDCLVVVSDVSQDDKDYRVGDLLELRRPDGTVLIAKTTYAFVDPPSGTPSAVMYGLVGMTKETVPIGTEAWLDCTQPRQPRKVNSKFERIEPSTSQAL